MPLRRVSNSEVQTGFGAGDGSCDGGGVRLDGDGFRVGGGELEAVEKDCGALGVDAVAGERGDEEGDGDLDGFPALDRRKVELDWTLSSVIGRYWGFQVADVVGSGSVRPVGRVFVFLSWWLVVVKCEGLPWLSPQAALF